MSTLTVPSFFILNVNFTLSPALTSVALALAVPVTLTTASFFSMEIACVLPDLRVPSLDVHDTVNAIDVLNIASVMFHAGLSCVWVSPVAILPMDISVSVGEGYFSTTSLIGSPLFLMVTVTWAVPAAGSDAGLTCTLVVMASSASTVPPLPTQSASTSVIITM